MGDFVKINGFNYHYVKKGDKGHPIVLVHGLPMSSYLWRKVQDCLADRYQVYAIDMLGYGQSDKPPEASLYTWTAQAERLAKFIDTLRLGKVALAGHDHGGGVTQIMICNNPDKVSHYIFMNGCCYDYCLPDVVRAMGTLINFPDDTLKMFQPFAIGFFSALLQFAVAHETSLNIPIMQKHMEPFKSFEGFKSLIHHCAIPCNEELLRLDLKKIKVPTLILWALKDRFLPFEAAQRLQKDLGGPVIVDTVANAGHFLQEDEPQEVALKIHNFLSMTK